MSLNIIVAMTKDRVIGKDGTLPWRIPEDMKLFKRHTMGHPVIMGRTTYESIPEKFRPLPGRDNLVISSTMPESDEIEVYRCVEDALSTVVDAFVIGGASVYEQTLDHADRLYISEVKGEFEGDTYFPEVDFSHWNLQEEKDFAEFVFRLYHRK